MAKRPEPIVVRPIAQLSEVVGTRRCISISAGPRLEIVILALDSEPDYRVETARGSFPKRLADQPNHFSLYYQAGNEWGEVRLPNTRENYHHVQPLRNDGWLVVRGRSAGDDDANAHVFDASGRHVRSFPAGDGIQDVQSDESGKIWVSYFDEGVFGKTRLGNSGLVCLDGHGRLMFDFQNVSHGCVKSMADCYALNVCSSHETWLCYYTDFPLVKLVDGKLADVWQKLPIAGSPAFAVDGTRTLWAGGYENRDSLAAFSLGKKPVKEFKPVDNLGEPISNFAAFGRRSSLFLATAERVLKVDVRDVP